MWSRKCFGITIASSVRGYKKCTVPVLYHMKQRQKRVGIFMPQRSSVVEWDFEREIQIFCKRFGLQPGTSIKDSFVTQDYVDKENEQRRLLGIEPVPLTSNKDLAADGMQKLREISLAQIGECYPKLPAQAVSALSNYLCSPESLASIATQMGLPPLVVRSGEGLKVDPQLLTDTLLALFASIENRNEFCTRYVLIQLAGKDVFDIWHPSDVSLLLNQILKSQNLPPYEPRLIGEAGRNTLESVFYVAVYSETKFLGKGAGETQAAGIDMAVRDALKRLFGVTRAARSPFEIMALKNIRQRNAGLTA